MAQDEVIGGDKGDADKSKSGSVADFLQAPRKKRKSYVITALGSSVKGDLQNPIEHFVRVNFKQVAISHPSNAEELLKTFTRQIVLLIFDDEFIERGAGMELVKTLKRRKNGASIPVLFITRNQVALVDEYHARLLPYHEIDDYLVYSRGEYGTVFSKIRKILSGTNRRRSRRYRVDLPVNFGVLGDKSTGTGNTVEGQSAGFVVPCKGRIEDLSMHGMLLNSADGRIFRKDEQITVQIPVSEYVTIDNVDFLRLSARVRRVFISGDKAGLSFEFVTERQSQLLADIITELVRTQTSQKNIASRVRAARV